MPLLLFLALLFAAMPVSAQSDALRGVVYAADGGAPGVLRVTVATGGRLTATDVDDAGRFDVPLDFTAFDTIDVLIDAPAAVTRRYFPARLRFSAELLSRELRVVLLPLEWEVKQGRFAGTRVSLSPQDAWRSIGGGARSSFFEHPPDANARRTNLASWSPDALPIPVVLLRNGAHAASAADSVELWQAIAQVEDAFGFDLFRPMSEATSLLPDTVVRRGMILISIDPSMHTIGAGGAIRSDGVIFGGRVNVRGSHSLRDGALVAHELLHSLGFGHTCAWPSVMATSACETMRSDALTAYDVAHALAYMRVWELQRRHGADGLAALYSGTFSNDNPVSADGGHRAGAPLR